MNQVENKDEDQLGLIQQYVKLLEKKKELAAVKHELDVTLRDCTQKILAISQEKRQFEFPVDVDPPLEFNAHQGVLCPKNFVVRVRQRQEYCRINLPMLKQSCTSYFAAMFPQKSVPEVSELGDTQADWMWKNRQTKETSVVECVCVTPQPEGSSHPKKYKKRKLAAAHALM